MASHPRYPSHRHPTELPDRPDQPDQPGAPARVWYAAYGSNMHRARLDHYLTGGRPPDGARTYPGCRDGAPPARSLPVLLPGGLHFAQESRVWTGGMAFYDPLDPGRLPARAYLISAGQLADIATQEMHLAPDTPPAPADAPATALATALATGRAELGPGRYETLICAGWLDGDPVLTFTAPWRSARADLNRPSPHYLRHCAAGLREAHGWDAARCARYLAGRPGALGAYPLRALAALLESPGTGPPPM
ncbi:histone deacetylase [Kitasatospora sp. NPDC050543]|uniref:histone deacetylase n=1 Tax=Kitasatospora sp. NPDC050543 TaxID=3364054 RepID=UPI0037B1CB54